MAVSAPSPISFATRVFGPWIERVNRRTLRADLLAGLLGAVLVLPQGIAFATLAGLPPQYGLYTAIVPCAVAALFGSSWHVMSGPTNANSLALFAMLAPLAAVGSPQYIELALTVTLLVGLLQWLIGTLRLGTLANFISPSVLLGFTGGAAALIAIHSLSSLLGVPAGPSHAAGATLLNAATHLSDAQPPALAVGVLTLIVAAGVRRVLPRWPFMLIGLAAGTALAVALNRWGWFGAAPIAAVGAIPSALPPLHVPQIDPQRVPELLGLAFALTIVALGQSISIAKVVALRSGQRIDANREFIGQGLSNIAGAFFSSYVSCGSLNRSLPNYEAGAQTPLAAVAAAVLLVVLVAVSAPLLALIPLAAVAGLLIWVAWSLFDVAHWQRLARIDRSELGIAAATFVATVTLRLETAILLGTILSLVVYLYRTAKPALRTMGFDTMAEDRRFVVLGEGAHQLPECPQLKLLRMEGAVYFGAVEHVSEHLHKLRSGPQPAKHLLVMAKSMNFIDAAGAALWQAELDARRKLGGDLYFHRPRPQVIQLWERTRFLETLGRDHVFPDKRTAIGNIFERLDREICAKCRARVFWECGRLPPPG
jgi:SulP family sulfate permease